MQIKLNDKTKEAIKHLSQTEGLSGRYIAGVLGLGKTTVNDYLSSLTSELITASNDPTGPKILLYDLETAPTLAYTFGRWKQNISQDSVIEEGSWIICASYKWLGDSEVKSIVFPYDVESHTDSSIVAELWELYEQADAVIAHNSLGFDHKILQSRCMINGFPALSSVKVLDTLQMAKKNFKLNSNKLDSIADILNIGRKKQTGGIKLWVDVLNGDKQALATMVEYCNQDTVLLEQVFLRLRSYGLASNFNAAHYHKDEKERCPTCGSEDLSFTGKTVFTDVSEFTEKICNDCGSRHRTRKVANTKEKRQSLLTAIKM